MGTLASTATLFTYTPGAKDTLTSTFTASDGSTPPNNKQPDRQFSAQYTCVAGQSLSYTKTFADQNVMVDAATVRLTASG